MIEITKNGVSYKLNNETKSAVIIKSPNAVGDLLIPKSIQYNSQDYLICRIDEESFIENRKIKTISFSKDSSIETIGQSAFESTNINSISIPDSVMQIEKFCFVFCTYLHTINITPNSNLRSIGPQAFANIPIQSLFIPSKLEELSEGWCDRTSSLITIEVSPTNQNYKFIDEKYLLGKSSTKSDTFDVLHFARRDISHAKIPPYIKHISPFAFNQCCMLESIDFSENSELETIGANSFRDCIRLTSIFIPRHVNIIEKQSFHNCNQLRTVVFSQNSELKIIGRNSFNSCSFESFSVPSNVTEIQPSAFYNCKRLSNVKIPVDSKLVSLGNNAFFGSGLVGFCAPSSIKHFGAYAFSECDNLSSAEFLGEDLCFEKKIFKDSCCLLIVSFPNLGKAAFGHKSFLNVSKELRIFCNVNAKLDIIKK